MTPWLAFKAFGLVDRSVTFAAYAFATHKPVYQFLSLISAAFAYLVLPVVIGFFNAASPVCME
jgi:hypothetical protein